MTTLDIMSLENYFLYLAMVKLWLLDDGYYY